VVPRLQAHDRGYLLQNFDKRVIFAVPFAEAFTLIGTTETAVSGDPAEVAASAEEILYLCRAAGDYFRASVEPSRIVWNFAGVRALVDDGSTRDSDTARDYKIEIDGDYGEAPLVSVFGGKLTTYRRVAAAVVDKLKQWFVLGPAWTHEAAARRRSRRWRGRRFRRRAVQTHPYLAGRRRGGWRAATARKRGNFWKTPSASRISARASSAICTRSS
jgi:glycerol-3-phosphate dehydrogenase